MALSNLIRWPSQQIAPLLMVALLSACAHRGGSYDPTISTGTSVPATGGAGTSSQIVLKLAEQPAPSDVTCDWTPSKLEALSLGDALIRAICSNTRVADSILAVKADIAQHAMTFNQFLPTATASTQNARSYTRAQSFSGFSRDTTIGSSHALAVNWLLWDFGGRLAQTRAAEHTALASFAMQDVVAQATIAATAEAYLNVMTFQEMREAAAIAVASAKRAVSLAKVVGPHWVIRFEC